MKVRTITAGIILDLERMEGQIEATAGFLLEARDRFISEGIEVQTLRVATQRWETYPLESMPLGIPEFVSDLEGKVRDEGLDFLSVGPAVTPAGIKMIPSIIESTTSTCCSAVVSDGSGVKVTNIDQAADTVREVSKIASSGMKGFMFAAIANCQPDTPFFPASYPDLMTARSR